MTKVKAICNFKYLGADFTQGQLLEVTEEQAIFLSSDDVKAVTIIAEDKPQALQPVVASEATTETPEATVTQETPVETEVTETTAAPLVEEAPVVPVDLTLEPTAVVSQPVSEVLPVESAPVSNEPVNVPTNEEVMQTAEAVS